jgi:hypothetical protein
MVIICQMVAEGELCTRLCVWRKGGLEFFLSFFSGCTLNILIWNLVKQV